MSKKIRVAIYARVSTKHEAQMLALENQVEWYKRLFERYPDWELYEMYTDEGITATSTKRRADFNRMIADAYADKFDLIVTREVSRFARNILDAIGYARELRKVKKYILFVTDFIDTREDDYETKLAYISSIAQEESRKTSIRAKCGQQISMEKGVIYGNGNILGYDRKVTPIDEKNKIVEMVINPEQAETVKMIFDWYLGGWGLEKIKYELEAAGRLTATGKSKWFVSVISKTLKNPFYCGKIVYRKQYVPEYLEQKKVINYGDVENIVVEGKHEPIISKEDFDRVQEKLNSRRQEMPYVKTGRLPKGIRPPTSVWCTLLRCVCGHKFNRRKWNRSAVGTQYGYQCYDSIHTGTVQTRQNKGLSTDDVCDTPMIQEWKLQMMAKAIFDNAPLEIDDTIALASSMIEKHINDTPDDVKNNSKVIEEIQAKISKLQKRVEGLILMRADGEISKEMYLTQKEQAESEIKALEDKLENLVSNDTPIVEKSSESIAERLTVLKNALNTYAVFDTENDVPDRIVDAFVEKVVVSKDSFDWYLRYAPETAVNCNVEGRKGKANVAFAPNTPFTSSQHRLPSRGNFPDKIHTVQIGVDFRIANNRCVCYYNIKTKKVGGFMTEFTYETNDTSRNLERFEWDNVWWEQTANETSKRILYIGDSISCGTRRLITSLSKSEILCDGFGTSKALDNPYFKSSLELFMKQQNKCDAILFNNGLHGWHLSNEEYEKCYDDMLLFLLKAEKPIFIVLTTDDISSQRRNGFVKARNEVAKALAQKYHLPVIDLHTVATSNSECHVPDGVHFNAMGYELLAKCILESIC